MGASGAGSGAPTHNHQRRGGDHPNNVRSHMLKHAIGGLGQRLGIKRAEQVRQHSIANKPEVEMRFRVKPFNEG